MGKLTFEKSVKGKIALADYPWTRSLKRSIDDDTILDLLGIVHYEADRAMVMEMAGIDDFGNVTTVLLDYVLDALGCPPSGEVKYLEGETSQFSRDCTFDRDGFYQYVFGDFAVEYDGVEDPNIGEMLAYIKHEIANNLRSYYK